MKKGVKPSPISLGNSSPDSGNEPVFVSGVVAKAVTTPPPPPQDIQGEASSPSREVGVSVSSPYFRWFLWSAAFLLTATISAALGATLALVTPLSPLIIPQFGEGRDRANAWRQGFPYDLARPVNILVMGIDRVPNVPENSPESFAGRSDTLLLLRLDPIDDSVRMLSIPRDTQVEIPDVGIAKINNANVEGDRPSPPGLSVGP